MLGRRWPPPGDPCDYRQPLSPCSKVCEISSRQMGFRFVVVARAVPPRKAPRGGTEGLEQAAVKSPHHQLATHCWITRSGNLVLHTFPRGCPVEGWQFPIFLSFASSFVHFVTSALPFGKTVGPRRLRPFLLLAALSYVSLSSCRYSPRCPSAAE